MKDKAIKFREVRIEKYLLYDNQKLRGFLR